MTILDDRVASPEDFEPAPVPDLYVEQPAPVPDLYVEEPVPVPDLYVEEPVPVPDLYVEEPVPVPDLYVEEPVPVPDLYVEEPAPASQLDALALSTMPKGPRSLRWSIVLSLTGLTVSIVTAFSDQHLDPGLWGLPGSINRTWYVGLVLILAGIGTARRSDGVDAGVAVGSLVLALTATPAIVYDIPRLPWTEKHVGVVNYILHFGQVHSSIDIYQAWAGLFSATAWLARAGGIHDPLVIARVWPPIVDVLVLLAVRCLAGRLLGNPYRAWIAAGVFMLAGAFNLDYFSPQSISLLLAISLYAVVAPAASAEGSVVARFRLPRWRIGVVVILSLAMAVTHQITPYFVVASLVVLVLFGLLRPVWIPLVPLVPAAAWALINYQAWKGYFSFSEIFNLGANVQTPGATIVGEHPDVVLRLSTFALAAGPFVVGVLAVAFLVRSHRRVDIALAVCAASAGSLVLVTDYGQEGLYRITLFALPWLCILALGNRPKALFQRAYSLVPLFALLTTTFLFANFALDGMTVVRPSEVQAERNFELSAPPGSMLMYLGANDTPVNVTSRYTEVQTSQESFSSKDKISQLVDSLVQEGANHPRFYVATSEAGMYAGQLYRLYGPQYYREVDSALRTSPHFRTVFDEGGTQVFELRTSTRP